MSFRKYFLTLHLTIYVFINIFNIQFVRSDSNIESKSNSKALKTELLNLQEDLYILDSGDTLSFSVIGVPELKTDLKILNDGNAIIPILGPIKLRGLTISGATKLLQYSLANEIIDPKVELFILQNRPIKISIIGEVARPGIYKLNAGNNDLPTVITSIERAGGLSNYANLNNIKLLRKLPGNSLEYKKTDLNFRDLILNGDQSQNPYLFDGDIVKIEKAKNLDKEILSIASTSFSPSEINVNFIGEVKRPGNFKLPPNKTLIDGILAAGGPADSRSNYSNVEILRINRNGTASRKRYRIDLSQNYSEKNNPILNDGDSVWIKRNSFAKTTDTLGLISSPIRDVVSIWSIFKIIQ